MVLSEVNVLSGLSSAPRVGPDSAKEVAVEFDTMIWKLVLRESGLLRPLAADSGNETAMLGELFIEDFARELAAQIDIGFGRMALAAQTGTQTEGVAK